MDNFTDKAAAKLNKESFNIVRLINEITGALW